MQAFQKGVQATLKALGTKPDQGLSENQVEKSRQEHGKNVFVAEKKTSLAKKILLSLKDVATIILLIAAGISFVATYLEGSNNYFESLLVIGIVVINSALSIFQEGKAESSLAALKDLNKSQVKVLRDGQPELIDSDDVVVGDILLLENGRSIAADARLIEAVELQTEESALTGESLPVEKDADATFEGDKDVDLGERVTMVYRGTTVVNGHGLAIVTAVGMATEMGKIASLLNNENSTPLTPLQRRLAQLGRNISYLAIISAIVVLTLGIAQGMDLKHIFLTAISLAVAIVPETLPVIVTMTLALGVQRIAKKHAIIRRLPAVETLGTTNVIASDKTGTLTQNKMTVRQVWQAGQNQLSATADGITPEAEEVLSLAAMSTNVAVAEDEDGETRFDGLPTEVALVRAIDSIKSRDDLLTEYPVVDQVPFNSTKKRMTTVHQRPDGGYIAITKGAFDVLAPMLANGDVAEAEKINQKFGRQALRVLTITKHVFNQLPEEPTQEFYESNLELVGLVGIIDPPRPESAAAVAQARQAGVKTVMITGDHVETASAIAREIGILQPGDKTLTGAELAQLSDAELDKNVKDYSVYARVTPTDKIRIIKSWQRQDATIAMTGDGVNDAPALKAANVGISMGQTGTDVARGASDIVLTDDNFATIISAIEEGRGVYVKVRKTINFLLSANISELIAILIAMILGWGSPLLPIHLLFINLVADGLPGFALSREPMLTNVMDKAPMPKNASLFSQGLGRQIALNASLFALVTLGAIWFGQNVTMGGIATSEEVGQTMAFVVLSLTSIIHVFNIRSEKSLFSIRYGANPSLVNMAILATLITIAVSVIPGVQGLFGLVSLSASHWLMIVLLTVVPTIILEILKKISPKLFQV
ncbi:Magnesium-transporting ATPase (P-type) (MgtA) [Fructobacillus tropaeoli]|uniref:Magnesium-transporting ATPase (P-type) (MgtA) n=1 Tax=Fructobacillus tropaeoli TaxID=709323 RepID=A0ABM9MT94_9LACO|nr:Magnesium-transporting ATPase (P-type) (MgtA) [Fructobacillus tropaeoli]CAK1238419.1 Magnesium-transporting ATPase (P-type) (MgtA) [Fructobacillus tropaeoli]